MQAAIAERVCTARTHACRPSAQPRALPAEVVVSKVGNACACRPAGTAPVSTDVAGWHVQARLVLARAAAEEVNAASTNGAPLKPATAAMDFDELTELIK